MSETRWPETRWLDAKGDLVEKFFHPERFFPRNAWRESAVFAVGVVAIVAAVVWFIAA